MAMDFGRGVELRRGWAPGEALQRMNRRRRPAHVMGPLPVRGFAAGRLGPRLQASRFFGRDFHARRVRRGSRIGRHLLLFRDPPKDLLSTSGHLRVFASRGPPLKVYNLDCNRGQVKQIITKRYFREAEQ